MQFPDAFRWHWVRGWLGKTPRCDINHMLCQHPCGPHYFGLKDAKADIEVISERANKCFHLILRQVVADDISYIEACVLKITQRLPVQSEELELQKITRFNRSTNANKAWSW